MIFRSSPSLKKNLTEPAGKGGFGPNYKWNQTLKDVDVVFNLPNPSPAKNISVKITRTTIKIFLKSDPSNLIIDVFAFFLFF